MLTPDLMSSQSVVPYCVPPHPANQAFAKGMEAVVMKTLGMNLSSITTSDNFPWPAIQIRDYFTDHFGEQAEQPVTPNVPAFLLPPEQRVSPQIIPAAFRYRLTYRWQRYHASLRTGRYLTVQSKRKELVPAFFAQSDIDSACGLHVFSAVLVMFDLAKGSALLDMPRRKYGVAAEVWAAFQHTYFSGVHANEFVELVSFGFG